MCDAAAPHKHTHTHTHTHAHTHTHTHTHTPYTPPVPHAFADNQIGERKKKHYASADLVRRHQQINIIYMIQKTERMSEGEID